MAGAKVDVDAETGDGGSFSEQRLIDKLKRLNNSAASIQSILSSLFTFLRACKFGSLGCCCLFSLD